MQIFSQFGGTWLINSAHIGEPYQIEDVSLVKTVIPIVPLITS